MTQRDNSYNDTFATHLSGNKSSNEHPARGVEDPQLVALSRLPSTPNTIFSCNKSIFLSLHSPSATLPWSQPPWSGRRQTNSSSSLVREDKHFRHLLRHGAGRASHALFRALSYQEYISLWTTSTHWPSERQTCFTLHRIYVQVWVLAFNIISWYSSKHIKSLSSIS